MKILEIINSGGLMVYPILILGIIATILAVDKFLTYKKLAIINSNNPKNYYFRFTKRIEENSKKPIWFIESQAKDEAALIEKELGSHLWILETTVTIAPLLGLLGTIIGIMDAFKLMGVNNISNFDGITAGVAEALIATAFGLLVAILALFVFNFFSEKQSKFMDDLERMGTKLIDQIKLDQI